MSAAWLLLAAGCGPPRTPYPAALNSERPDERVWAIRHAAQTRDFSVLSLLVDRLEDEDEVVRLFAILALEKLTGTRLGYEYQAPEAQRWRAVESWRRHLARSGSAARRATEGGQGRPETDALDPAAAQGGSDR
jgi:hypothetical protein